jgi:outer membrane protein assembly factor BamB
MMTHDRDALIRAALTPPPDVQLPSDLEGEIYRALLATPQRQPRLGGLAIGRRLPQVPSGLAWLAVVTALLLAALAIFAIASRPTPSILSDVVNYHGDPGLTGVMPGPGPKGSVAIGWQVALQGPLGALNMPLLHDHQVDVADGRGTITTLDAANGHILRSNPGFGSINGTPAIAAGRLIVAADIGTVVALDVATGTQLWRQAIGAPTTAQVATFGDVALVGSEDGFVHLLDVVSGNELRKVDAGGSVERSPAIADGIAYVGASGGRLTAFDVATGAIRWAFELGKGEVLTPAVTGGVVYVAHGPLDLSVPHEVVALNAADRSVRWRWPGKTVARLFMAGVADGAVFISSEDHNIYRVDAATGAGDLFFATAGSVGTLAAIADGTVYITSADQHVYALDPVSGAEDWNLEVEGTPTMPVVIDGRVIVGTSLGKLVAIEGSGVP